MSSLCHWEGDTLVLNILGRPRAKKTAIGKVIGKQLRIKVPQRLPAVIPPPQNA